MIGYDDETEEEYGEGPGAARDAPLASDLDQDENDDYDESICSACGATVSELTDKCPSCGEWIVHGLRKQRRTWVITAVVIVLIVGLFWLTVG